MKNYKSESAYPDFSYKKITDVSPIDLKMMGVKAVAIDLDNTTVAFSSNKLEPGVREWIDSVRASGIKVIVITNTCISRAVIVSCRMGRVPFIPYAFKPSTHGLRLASSLLDINVEEFAMIGDQLFTDVLSANRLGAVSVKVEPLGNETILNKYHEKKRALEKQYLENYENKQGLITYDFA